MNEEIVKQYPIKKEMLDQTNYLQSLLQEAYRLQLLSDGALQQTQMQIVELVTNQIKRYTHGESSSVKVETAQQIMQSVLYTVGLYLKGQSTEESVKALESTQMAELFAQGQQFIKKQIAMARVLLASVQSNCIHTQNYAYNQTLRYALPDFFVNYEAEFSAHETAALIDYPLYYDKMDTVGIEYIYEYLEKLYWENVFCKKFPDAAIFGLLNGYHTDSKNLLINIFELVLTNSLGSVLLNRDALQLYITPTERKQLQDLLFGLSKEQLKIVVEKAQDKLVEELQIEHTFLEPYIKSGAEKLTVNLSNALCNHVLHTVFITPKQSAEQPKLQYTDGRKMGDALFRKITERIRACKEATDKIAIIHTEIHSFADLMDILDAYCIFSNEYESVYRSLDDSVLALLLQKLPYVDFNKLDFKDITKQLDSFLCEKEWQNQFVLFLQRLDTKHLQKIITLGQDIK